MGFLSSDGRYAHCGREEYATNGLSPDRNGVTYPHRLDGPCKCGQTHGAVLPRPPRSDVDKPPRMFLDLQWLPKHVRKNGEDYRWIRDYEYRDAQGTLYYLIRRFEQ